MNFASLPHYAGDPDGATPGREPPPDRHSWEFAATALLVAVAIGLLVLAVLVLFLTVIVGVPAGPVFASLATPTSGQIV